MAKETLQTKLSNALIAKGCAEVKSTTRKYRTFKGPNDKFYFVGRAGGVRINTRQALTDSLSCSDRWKETLLNGPSM